MQNNDLLVFFATFPFLYLVFRVLPLLKIPKNIILNVIFLFSFISLTIILSEYLQIPGNLIAYVLCTLSVFIKNATERTTFYKIIKNHFIIGISFLALADIISYQGFILLLSILPIVDMKSESLKAIINSVLWLVFSLSYLILKKNDVAGLESAYTYFITLFYILGTIKLFNRKFENLSGVLLFYAFYNLTLKQFEQTPEFINVFFLGLQFVFLIAYMMYREEESLYKSILLFVITSYASVTSFEFSQLIYIALVLILEFNGSFKIKSAKNFEVLVLMLFFVIYISQLDYSSLIVKLSTITMLVSISISSFYKINDLDYFVHS